MYLHNSWKIYLIWTVIWQECCRLCQLFKNSLLSPRDSLILLYPSPAFWKSFLNFHRQQLLSARAVTSDLSVLFFSAVLSNFICYPRSLHRCEGSEEKKITLPFFHYFRRTENFQILFQVTKQILPFYSLDNTEVKLYIALHTAIFLKIIRKALTVRE